MARPQAEGRTVGGRKAVYAWLDARDQINGQSERIKRNIRRILPAVVPPEDRERWTEYYHVFQCAIDATRDAYMPNAQRKKEYLRIYEDVVQQNEILVSYLAKRQNATLTSNLLNATADRTLAKGSVIREAMTRWNESRHPLRGSQSGGSSGGDGEESVNR